MRKTIIVLSLILISFMSYAGATDWPTFWEQQEQERLKFASRLNTIPQQERAAELKKHREKQYQALRNNMEQQLSMDTSLTNQQKAEIIRDFDKQYAKNQIFMNNLANDTKLTNEQKKEKAEAYFKAQAEENSKKK